MWAGRSRISSPKPSEIELLYGLIGKNGAHGRRRHFFGEFNVGVNLSLERLQGMTSPSFSLAEPGSRALAVAGCELRRIGRAMHFLTQQNKRIEFQGVRRCISQLRVLRARVPLCYLPPARSWFLIVR